MALAGWPLGLLFRVSAPEVLAGQKVVNDAAYLVEQSGPLLWVFAAIALAGVATTAAAARGRAWPRSSSSPPLRPSSSWPRRRRRRPTGCRPRWSAPRAPSSASPARATSCCSGPAPATRRRRWSWPAAASPTSASRPYLTQFAPRADLEARHEVVYRFFRTTSRDEALAIARSLDARFVALYGRRPRALRHHGRPRARPRGGRGPPLPDPRAALRSRSSPARTRSGCSAGKRGGPPGPAGSEAARHGQGQQVPGLVEDPHAAHRRLREALEHDVLASARGRGEERPSRVPTRTAGRSRRSADSGRSLARGVGQVVARTRRRRGRTPPTASGAAR